MLIIGKIHVFYSVIMTFQNVVKLRQQIFIKKIHRGGKKAKKYFFKRLSCKKKSLSLESFGKIPFFSFAFGISLFLWGRFVVGGQVWILICCSGSLFLLLSHPSQIFTLRYVERHRNRCFEGFSVGVDRLSAWPILSILPIIDIGHFKNRFADNFLFFIYFFIFMQTNILFTGDIIYWWINNTGETI